MTGERIITQQSFVQFILWMPALLIGVWIGAHGFRHMNQDAFRRWVLILLIALAAIGIGMAMRSLGQ